MERGAHQVLCLDCQEQQHKTKQVGQQHGKTSPRGDSVSNSQEDIGKVQVSSRDKGNANPLEFKPGNGILGIINVKKCNIANVSKAHAGQ